MVPARVPRDGMFGGSVGLENDINWGQFKHNDLKLQANNGGNTMNEDKKRPDG